MQNIETVLGPMKISELGFTLTHEHVVVSSAGIPHIYPEFIKRTESIKESIKVLKEVNSNGVDTIIDVTTIDLGRDIHLLEQVSKESGINIICATGTWRDVPRAFWSASIDSIKSLYIQEIIQGIEDTNIKAGIIKVANDSEGVTQEGEIILRAAARAQIETGTPISTHTWAPKKIGNDQIRIFLEEGVDLNRVYIGHSNDSTDIGYLKGIIEKGAWLGMDRYPGGRQPGTPNWEKRTEILARLILDGYGAKIMLGHDWAVKLVIESEENQIKRKINNPDGYLFIKNIVLPKLEELGVSKTQIKNLMVTNPYNFLSNHRIDKFVY